MTFLHKLLLSVLLMTVIGFAIWYFELTQVFSMTAIRQFIESYGIWGPLVYILLYALTIVLFIPLSPFAILGGVLFGPLFGSVYIIIAATLGATVSFFIAKHLGKAFIYRILKNNFSSIDEYNKKISENGFKTVFYTRLIPFIPFKVPNYIFGLTKIRTRDYVLGTFFGVIPESIVFAYSGDILVAFALWKIVTVVIVGMIIVAVGFWWKKRIKLQAPLD